MRESGGSRDIESSSESSPSPPSSPEEAVEMHVPALLELLLLLLLARPEAVSLLPPPPPPVVESSASASPPSHGALGAMRGERGEWGRVWGEGIVSQMSRGGLWWEEEPTGG